ncbi:hypothetical protein COOONC_26299 [Cooperia oncophora]
MVRTKQTARKPTGGKAPRKQPLSRPLASQQRLPVVKSLFVRSVVIRSRPSCSSANCRLRARSVKSIRISIALTVRSKRSASMVRTKQTARKSTDGKAPRKQLAIKVLASQHRLPVV